MLCSCALLSGCAELTIVAASPTPNQQATPSLPPIGFNHRYGNDPMASKDGFTLERSMFASRVFWEVAIRTDPAIAGYVDLTKPAAFAAARHKVTSVLVVIATEDRATITGLLAYGSHAGQERYCEALLNAVRAMGYDAFTKAQVLVFFTEADEHAQLSWTAKAGYTYAVYDNDLQGTGITARPGQTPLPAPAGP